MRTIALSGAAALSLLLAGQALAQPPGGWNLARREAWLQDRIDRGVANGSLARPEQRRVQRELRRIRSQERRLRARDRGVLTPGDRDRLEARLDNLSDHIRWARRNDFRRPW